MDIAPRILSMGLLALIVWTIGAPNEWSLRLIGTTTALLVTAAFLTAVGKVTVTVPAVPVAVARKAYIK